MNRIVPTPKALPRLWEHESIRGGLRRVLLGCLGRAVQAMADQQSAVPERVHRARIALKRARAVLRLGEAVGVAWAGAARRRVAALARELAAVRDATVVAETARRLGARAGTIEAGRAASWTAWTERLDAERLALARRRWPEMSRLDCVVALAGSVWRQHQREEMAARRASDHRLHAWRKTVIVLREQLNVLRPLLTAEQQRYATRLHLLARKLGAAQDLAQLIAAERRQAPTALGIILRLRARHELRLMRKRVRRQAKGLTNGLRGEFEVRG